jgi:hypothetical protein
MFTVLFCLGSLCAWGPDDAPAAGVYADTANADGQTPRIIAVLDIKENRDWFSCQLGARTPLLPLRDLLSELRRMHDDYVHKRAVNDELGQQRKLPAPPSQLLVSQRQIRFDLNLNLVVRF